MNLIKDKEQFNKFIEILPNLQNDEVYFLSLSARSKYLTDEEREHYRLGRTEMFGRTIVKKKEDFEFAMKKLEANLKYKTTKNGYPIPEKALVVYCNINPSSMIKAYNLFTTEMNKFYYDTFQAISNDKDPTVNYDGFTSMERKLMNAVQKSRARKVYIDIDMDKVGLITLSSFEDKIYDKGIEYHTVETQGGYHILIRTKTIPKGFNLGKLVKDFNEIAVENDGEVVFNSNQMVPVCGTLQAGKLVKFI
ncbi:MAG: hypothetical protein GY853_09735 [PVC group bacterium]|nr:hypothetical protein [PVC group bacterium]